MASRRLFPKMLIVLAIVFVIATVFTSCQLTEPVEKSTYYINDSELNYYNQDHTTVENAANEFSNSIGSLRTYLDSGDFVDTGYYMGVNFAIDLLDLQNNTVGNFQLKIKSYLYTYPYEDENGSPIYKYYEDGQYFDENNAEGTRKLISALEIHNKVSKKSDFSIEWYNGATNSVMIGLYFDGENSNVDDPGNILYVDIQGYKRSFANFGDTVLFQQMIRLLTSLSVEGLLTSMGLQDDAGAGWLADILVTLAQDKYKRIVNEPQTSLYFWGMDLNSKASDLTNLLVKMFGVFGRKWDPMTYKYLGFRFSTVANATITAAEAAIQSIISPTKDGTKDVLTDAIIQLDGSVVSDRVTYTYTTDITFDYGWSYPEGFSIKGDDTYIPFEGGQYEFVGTLYIPLLDTHYDALIRTDMNTKDNSKNNVFIEFRDIANGELMIGLYYKNERSYIDITGLEYLYGWIALEELGFPQVYDDSLDLAKALNSFIHGINNTIVSIVDSILDPESSDRENNALKYILDKTSFTEKVVEDIFSKNTETLRVDIDLVKKMLETTGQGTYSTRQIINILDSVSPYTMDQLAILLGISSAEVMLERSYFTLTWDVDNMDFTIIMYSDVGIPQEDLDTGKAQSLMIFSLELTPTHFGEPVLISNVNVDNFKPLDQIYTYSGTLEGAFVFSSQETVDLSKLLSATIGESSGLNTPYILATNAGLSFTLIYDQFVTDHVDYEDGVALQRVAGRSAFDLSVWLTGSEATIIIRLCSDDVSFNNEVYKDLPAREDELGYVWVDIACVTKNGVQTIPKVKIREDIFMASMSAYMNNETAITDDVNSFADNDFNLSLTSIITALCKDAYVVAEPEQLEITSSNDTLQSLFRVNGLIGNIKVDAGFRYRVKALRSIKKEYYLYEVGYFDNIEGNCPYDTALHSTLRVSFFEDYMDEYDPLKYQFYVYPRRTFLSNDTYIPEGTIMLFSLTARVEVKREDINAEGFYIKEGPENQDITRVMFNIKSLPFIKLNEDGNYVFVDYTNTLNVIEKDNLYVDAFGNVYVYWAGVENVVLYDSGTTYYYFDMDKALVDEEGNYIYLMPITNRDLLFEYDEESVKITYDCKKQYSPRTNGSFMGEVRRYYVRFESGVSAELGEIRDLYYGLGRDAFPPRYYSEEDENNEIIEYDRDGAVISQEIVPIQLFVMEPCEELATTCTVNVRTSENGVDEYYTFNAFFAIDWASVTTKGYMTVTTVTIAPGMMGEKTFPVRIIVLNREIDTNETATVYLTEDLNEYQASVPVVYEINIDPYDYILGKYEYMMNTDNFNPSRYFSYDNIMAAYKESNKNFIRYYFSKYDFVINFDYLNSYLARNKIDERYIQISYSNNEDGKITTYNWDLDAVGSNVESAINENGGTIYVHTYFKGQLIAMRINIGKREFKYVKFSDSDSFEKDPSSDIDGKYLANYYDESSYDVGKKPIFVFADEAGVKYERVFNMPIVTGLGKNVDGTYSSTYNILSSYSIDWKYRKITNISTSGSYLSEYEYSRIYHTTTTRLQTLYSALSQENKELKVNVIDTNGIVTLENYYVDDGGYAAVRNVVYWDELLEILENNSIDNTYEEVEYGDGKAYKYKIEMDKTDKISMIRNDDTSIVNRPFYYYYKKGQDDVAVLLTEEEYTLYIGNDPEIRSTYGLNTSITTSITSTNLDLSYLLRLFCLINNNIYDINIINNTIVLGTENTNTSSVGNFKYITVLVDCECPILEVDETTEIIMDQINSTNFTPNRVRIDNNKEGYYVLDPLNASAVYLPDNMLIYFKDAEGNVSSHAFYDLNWAREFDVNGDPIYIEGGKEIIQQVTLNGKTRYKIAIDLDELEGTLKFRLYVRIGNAVSGYRNIAVCVSILSKEPVNIVFFDEQENRITVQKTITNIEYKGDNKNKQMAYYTYYVNTYRNFKIPTTLEAEFSDGHKEKYRANWVITTGNEDYIFEPGKMINLKTVIGTSQDVLVEVYLVIIVENSKIDTIKLSGTNYSENYVVVQNGVGARKYMLIKELFNGDIESSGKSGRIGYYRDSYYIRVSDGYNGDIYTDKEDKDIPINHVGIFVKEGDVYTLVEHMNVYDLLMTLYSDVEIKTKKESFEYDSQTIIKPETNIYDYQMYLEGGGLERPFLIKNISTVSYEYDPTTQEDIVKVKFYYYDEENFIDFYPKLEANGNIKIFDENSNEREMSLAELTIYITTLEFSVDYSEYYVESINGEDKGKEDKLLSDKYFEYRPSTRTVILTNEGAALSEDSVFVLAEEISAGAKKVTIGYRELLYRLGIIYRDIKVTAGSEMTTISGKRIEIDGLINIMDINDMLDRGNGNLDGLGNKYKIELGTGKGASTFIADIRFVGGVYALDQDIQSVKIDLYNTMGEANYTNGYNFEVKTTGQVVGVYNNRTDNTKYFNYNIADTDAKLEEWYVEESDVEGIEVGTRIKNIESIYLYQSMLTYAVTKYIKLSTLTDEGFRITKIFSIYYPVADINSGYSGSTSGSFVINNGKITIDNIYLYKDNIADAFGSTNYLPKTINITLSNGDTYRINNVKWVLESSWVYRVNTLNYEGCDRIQMASATILGCNSNGRILGSVTISVDIEIKNTEVATFPWKETTDNLETETIIDSAGSKTFVVFIDPIIDSAESVWVKEKVFTLPTNLTVKYEDNQVVTFENVEYKYLGTKKVTKIPFGKDGINVTALTSSGGDLRGELSSRINKRFLDLTVELGLEQIIKVRVYFYDKSINETIEIGGTYYSDIMPEIRMDDEDIRQAIKDEFTNTIINYNTEIVGSVNENRIAANIELIFEKVQSIVARAEADISNRFETFTISTTLTSQADVEELLKAWMDSVVINPDIVTYSKGNAFTNEEAQKFGFDLLKTYYNTLVDENIGLIMNIIRSSTGSDIAKKNSVSAKITGILEDVKVGGYNSIIKSYMEFEFSNIFQNRINNNSLEEFNDAVYYKNMVQAKFEYDDILKKVYKFRNMYYDIQSEASSTISEAQLCSIIVNQIDVEDAIKDGFNVTTINGVISAIIVQEMYNAIRSADLLVTNNEAFEVIKEETIKLLKIRMNYENIKSNPNSPAPLSGAETEFTINRFASDIAMNNDAMYTQKYIRIYLINMISRFFDFTEVNTENYKDIIANDLIDYVNSTIANYTSQINNIRRQILKGSSSTVLVKRLFSNAIDNYIMSVIIEKEIKQKVEYVQKINNILVDSIMDLNSKYNNGEIGGQYLVDPYSEYAKLIKKYVIFFNSSENYLGVEGGYCYVTNITWDANEFEENISYNGYITDLTTNFVIYEDKVNADNSIKDNIVMKAQCDTLVVDNVNVTIPIVEKVRLLVETTDMMVDKTYVLDSNEKYRTIFFDVVTGGSRYDEIACLVYKYVDGFLESSYTGEKPLYYILFRKYADNISNPEEIRGVVKVEYFYKYNSSGDIIYKLENSIESNATIKEQLVTVFNPFEFSTTMMPQSIYINSAEEPTGVIWNNLKSAWDPTGYSSTEKVAKTLTGRISTSTGQEISIKFTYAKWGYVKIFKKTENIQSINVIKYEVNGEEETFIMMDPLQFFFSKYHDYSAEDYYLVSFGVKLTMEDNKKIVSKDIKFINQNLIKSGDAYTYKIETVPAQGEEEFIQQLFYPEDSRLLEYSTSDSDMETIKARKDYVIYWENLRVSAKNQVNYSGQGSINLGNEKVGETYSLTVLAYNNSAVKTAYYYNENMKIGKMQVVNYEGFTITELGNYIYEIYVEENGITITLDTNTNKYTTNLTSDPQDSVVSGETYTIENLENTGIDITFNKTTKVVTSNGEKYLLYESMKDKLMQQNGELSVYMSPYSYYPTEGVIELQENHISYSQDEITVRLIWNKTYSDAKRDLIEFVERMYPDVESTNREEYAKNILMSWNKKTEEEKQQIIDLAIEFNHIKFDYTGTYTSARARQDAYKLLCINEQFNYDEKNASKLKGGATAQNAKCTILVRVNNDTDIYDTQMQVRIIFADWTPIEYFVKTGNTYNNNLGVDSSNYNTLTEVYIAVRKEYYDAAQNKNKYEVENKTTPYDFTSVDNYKFLEFMTLSQNKDTSGTMLEESLVNGVKCYIIRVDSIAWDYNPDTNMLTSKTFQIGGKEYKANLLSTSLGSNG
ncbi:MAG: hypothetical protein K5765_01425 [Clostridia bacterium]|nr:hypothetical protein [Clostridia bacterium]